MLPARSGTVAAAGHVLEYSWTGPAPEEAATLVFLHEGLGCAGLWKDVPALLAARLGLGAVAYSRAGYGGSSPITLPRSADYLRPEATEVLPAVLTALGIRRAVLIGHSDGGSIALLAAGLLDDARIAGIVTEAAHVFVEEITLAGIRDARRAWETTDLRDRLARWHGANVDTAFHGWNDTWQTDAYRNWTMEDALPGVRVPALVIQGVDDQYGTEAQVDAICAGVRGPVRKMMVADCGHVPHFEQKQTVLDAMAAFVAELPLAAVPAR